jgi:hypothetical protein
MHLFQVLGILLALNIFTPVINAGEGDPQILTSSQRNEMLNTFKDVLIKACKYSEAEEDCTGNEEGGTCKECQDTTGGKCQPAHPDNRTAMVALLDGLYKSGVINVTTWTNYYNGFLAVTSSGDQSDWRDACIDYVNTHQSLLASSVVTQANQGEVATNRPCKNIPGLERLSYRYMESNGSSCSGKSKMGEVCSSHSDCCSELCNGLKDAEEGTCSVTMACLKRVPLNDPCGPENPYCEQIGTTTDNPSTPHINEGGNPKYAKCQPDSYEDYGMASCNKVNQACTSDDECCTGSCAAGKCALVMKCMDCYSFGEVCEECKTSDNPSKQCCAGMVPDFTDYSCGEAVPTFYLPGNLSTSVAPKKVNILVTVLKKVIHLLIPSAYAQNDCNQVGGCYESGMKGLTDEQISELQQAAVNCSKKSDPTERQECLDDLNQSRANFVQQNTSACNEKNSAEEKQACLDALGLGESFTQEDYVNLYNIPAFSAKERSDIGSCKFNSMADNWLDASNQERNAEIVIRAFEVMLSGVGTKDVHKIDDKPSLYERTKAIADKIKNYRMKMVMSLAKMDREMSCRCMEIFGPNTFPSDQQSAYQTHCSEYNQEAFNQESDKSKTDQANTADSGAIGISHEKVLVEWLNARAQLQMERFEHNITVEEDINSMIEDLKDIDWEETTSYRNDVAYTYTVEEMSTWAYVWALLDPIGGITNLMIASFTSESGDWWTGLGASFGTIGLIITWIIDANDESGSKRWYDKRVKPSEDSDDDYYLCGWLWMYECKDYDRHVYWPLYQANGCDVFSRRKHCLKNFYGTTLDKKLEGTEYETDLWPSYEKNPLVDIWIPKFYPANDSSFFVEDQQIMTKIRNGWIVGMEKLKKTNPGHRVDPTWRSEDPYMKEVDGLPVSVWFLPDLSNMLNDDSSFKPKYSFNQKKINTLKCAVIRYATCGWLDQCGEEVRATASETNLDACIAPEESYNNMFDSCVGVNPNSTGGNEGDDNQRNCEESEFGFRYFFQNSEDAKLFADYVYQMHFLWPHLSSDQYRSYPLLSFQAYLAEMYRQIQILGSLNGLRAAGYADAFNEYGSDLAKRSGMYDDAGVTTKMGNKSSNAKGYSKNFYQQFSLLKFDGSGSPEGFDGQIKKMHASGELTSAELKTLQGAARSAMRRVDQQKAAAHYEKWKQKDARGKAQLKKAKRFAAAFSNPLRGKMSLREAQNVKAPETLDEGKGEAKAGKKTAKAHKFTYKRKKGKKKGAKKHAKIMLPPPPVSKGAGSQLNSGLTNSETEHVLDSLSLEKGKNEPNPDDSLFTIISKGYRRNLSKVLVRENELKKSSSGMKADAKKIDNQKKDELKDLLGD